MVSAQNRERFYVTNFGDIEQPQDRGILLKDILETTSSEKGYELRAPAVGVGCRNRREDDGKLYRRFETSGIPKANALTTVQTDSMVAEPIRIGTIENDAKKQDFDSQQYRVYSPDGKSVTLCGNGGGVGAKTGLYACPVFTCGQYPRKDGKTNTLTTVLKDNTVNQPIYEVENGQITIKGKKYPIRLVDGLHIIRKLTPIECERLQTLPDNYTAAVSNTQRYKGLGNGWTAEVIIHILNGALKDVPKDEEIIVLSLYDGIGTGRYCLDKMGFTNVKYYAYEIDPYPIKIAMSNYPDIIQCGDAFRVRDDDWKIPD